MKSELKRIVAHNTAYVNIFESAIGRFVVLICLDAEYPRIISTLTQPILRKFGVDMVFNPASHPAPPRGRTRLVDIATSLTAAAVFANNHPKGGSFIYNGDRLFSDGIRDGKTDSEVDTPALRRLRPSPDNSMIAPGKI